MLMQPAPNCINTNTGGNGPTKANPQNGGCSRFCNYIISSRCSLPREPPLTTDDHGNHDVVLGANNQMHDFQIRRNNILSFIGGWVARFLCDKGGDSKDIPSVYGGGRYEHGGHYLCRVRKRKRENVTLLC